jgi:hypothetical protein
MRRLAMPIPLGETGKHPTARYRWWVPVGLTTKFHRNVLAAPARALS